MRLVRFEGPGSLILDEDAKPGWQVPLSGGLVGTIADSDVGGVGVSVVGPPHPPVVLRAEIPVCLIECGRVFFWDEELGYKVSPEEIYWNGGRYIETDFGLVLSAQLKVGTGSGYGWVLSEAGLWLEDVLEPCHVPSCYVEGVIYG